MIENAHPTASFWLNVIDKVIKLCAVLIGGIWTWWNYHKGRTYEQKIDLNIVGTVFTRDSLFGDVKLTVKNIGATQHNVQHGGTLCELSLVRDDLSEQSIQLFRVFAENDCIEPGESMIDTFCWRIPGPVDSIVWIKLTLHVVSNGVEWFSTCLVRSDAPAV